MRCSTYCAMPGCSSLQVKPNLVVCWGGHSIRRVEYDYTKRVGYEIGLRGMDVCTGCGPGAMKGPMKGATIGHSKQRILNGRYLGYQRTPASLRPNAQSHREPARHHAGHRKAPGGLRTSRSWDRRVPGRRRHAEEILYLLGILLDPANKDLPFR